MDLCLKLTYTRIAHERVFTCTRILHKKASTYTDIDNKHLFAKYGIDEEDHEYGVIVVMNNKKYSYSYLQEYITQIK